MGDLAELVKLGGLWVLAESMRGGLVLEAGENLYDSIACLWYCGLFAHPVKYITHLSGRPAAT